MSPRDEEREVEALAAAIRHHRHLYYNAQPEISDAEFDALEERLRRLAPDHPALAEVGAPPEEGGAVEVEATRLGDAEARAAADFLLEATERAYAGEPTDPRLYKQRYVDLLETAPDHPVFARIVPARGLEWPKSAHEIPMGSLNKVNTEQELRDWAARCDELAAEAGEPPVSAALSLTEKLDGISIELLYDGGELEAAITRGDGVVGERITPNVARMKGVPKEISHRGRVSIRGEIILEKSDVPAYERLKKAADPKFDRVKSLRNTASGVARTKLHELLPATRYLTARFYDVEGVEGMATESDKQAFIEKQGFERPFASTGDIEHVLSIYHRYADTNRKSLDYEIDGLVIRAERLSTADLLGELNHRPRAAVAFKFGNEMEVSKVRAIEWNTGDTGRITPVARVDPVMLAGAEVRQASLHNLGLVRELGIAAGDDVLVSRRNDVIPYVEKVVLDAGGRTEAPEACSSCGTTPVVDGEYLVCPNFDCPARRRGRIKTWVKQLGLLEWGEKTLERLFDEGLAREPADLYRLRIEDITALRGFGEDTARKLLEPLNAKKAVPFPVFVAALGIPAVSRETGKLLAQAGFSSVEEVLEAGRDRLAELEGLGAIKADKIIGGLRDRRDEIARLREVGVEATRPADEGPLAGLSFCFSGSHSRPRKELAKLVESQGGTVTSGVKKGLSYLVLSDANSTSSKAQKARKLGTEIVDEAGFEAIVRERGGELA
jgi:DNA ligase (NAD+)